MPGHEPPLATQNVTKPVAHSGRPPKTRKRPAGSFEPAGRIGQ